MKLSNILCLLFIFSIATLFAQEENQDTPSSENAEAAALAKAT